MDGNVSRRAVLGGAAVTLLLGACSAGGFGGPGAGPAFPSPQPAGPAIGGGQVPVALLLPLSGDPALAEVGISMANAAQLAMDFIAQSEGIGDNITLTIKDTGATAGGAAQAASQALGEGAKLILGPLKADQVTAAGSVARAAGVPLIGFSNNSGAAGPGVYLLNVLPEAEVRRSMPMPRRRAGGLLPASSPPRISGACRRAPSGRR